MEHSVVFYFPGGFMYLNIDKFFPAKQKDVRLLCDTILLGLEIGINVDDTFYKIIRYLDKRIADLEEGKTTKTETLLKRLKKNREIVCVRSSTV